MAAINLIFNHDINVSVQVGDLVYWVPTVPIGVPGTLGNWASATTPHDSAPREYIILIGPVLSFTPWNGSSTTITAEYDPLIAALHGSPTNLDFMLKLSLEITQPLRRSCLLLELILLKVVNNS